MKGNIEGVNTYSIYFGQSYGKDLTAQPGNPASNVSFGEKVFLIDSVTDLAGIPTSFTQEDIIDFYSQFFESSAVKVFGIVNVVYIFRRLIETTPDVANLPRSIHVI